VIATVFIDMILFGLALMGVGGFIIKLTAKEYAKKETSEGLKTFYALLWIPCLIAIFVGLILVIGNCGGTRFGDYGR